MSSEADRLRDPAARQFGGYQGKAPIFLGRMLHVDGFDDGSLFVSFTPADATAPAYSVDRQELVAAARAILNHFGEKP